MEKLFVYNFVAIFLIVLGFVVSLSNNKNYDYRIAGVCIASVGIFMIVSFVVYAMFIVYFKQNPIVSLKTIHEIYDEKKEEPTIHHDDDAQEICSYIEVEPENYDNV